MISILRSIHGLNQIGFNGSISMSNCGNLSFQLFGIDDKSDEFCK
ncbi:hypothetical protein [Wocania arenilitoris]|nr:hypothetical protein [Wocania arenilitoris]